ncbi:DUF6438 domain-containing protein [uncultured Sphingomonas sp.]|uniref:DUF6438 domain-containing protein n=1 Tax=uncultured Sphingomonas sp. TaxID=158754 RepID=UPI0026028348|nr:DUF6438 domain-containing protein [uncultured Sphingomonas sp.]
MTKTLGLIALAAATLAGCAATGDMTAGGVAPAAGEAIRYSVSPCYGTCPVYAVTVLPSGQVMFDGQEHTAAKGQQEKQAGVAAYRRFAAALAPYRPMTGITAATQCEQQVSDQQGYRIAWIGADGRETVLTHDRGCLSPTNRALNTVMDAAPKMLGIGVWIGR